MDKKRLYISNLNNLISGIGIITLGVIITIGSIKLYSFVVSLLVCVFIVYGISKLINFLINRKIVRNAQTLFLILSNILFGIFMIIFPKLKLSIIPIFFSIYLILNAIVKFINYTILRKANLSSRFIEIIACLLYIIVSFMFLIYPLDKLNIFIMIIGIYCVILGLSMIIEFVVDILSYNTKLKIKRKSKMTVPVFLDAFFPKRSLKKIYKKESEDFKTDIDSENYIKLLIHLSNYSVNQFGHIDIEIDKKIYSYGNYDRSTRRLFNGLGDGVLFITDNKPQYIGFCLKNNREIIVEYGLELTESQKAKVIDRLNNIINDLEPWDPPSKFKKKKKLYYAEKLYKATKANFYKFKSSELKTFFIAGVNCTYFINILLEGIFQRLKLVGVLSPGTYYEYLEENYKKKNSNIKYKKIYRTKDGDYCDKN